MSNQKAEKAVEALTDFINGASYHDKERFVLAMMKEHRTLQQETFNIFMDCVQAWAKQGQNGNYDERNMRAVMASQHILKAFNS